MSIEETLARVRTELVRLNPAEAAGAASQPNTYIVDVRPEFQRRRAGELPGAIVIERNHLEWRLDPHSATRIPEAVDATVRWIIVCEGGYSSSLAAHSLRQIGLLNSTDIIGARPGRQPVYRCAIQNCPNVRACPVAVQRLSSDQPFANPNTTLQGPDGGFRDVVVLGRLPIVSIPRDRPQMPTAGGPRCHR
jgi:rhodanese-related sulfurtransferase